MVSPSNEPDGQGETQFPLGRLMELSAMEARADKVEFRLGKGAFHA
jgi:hypothetical protein